jgi:hypothetical protein
MEEINDTTSIFDSYRRPLTFVLLLAVDIPAIICALFILIFFCSHWHSMIRKTLHHHATFLLIMISFLYSAFDLPFSMNYLRLGYHSYRSVRFCLWWYWFDYTLLNTSLLLTATASIQRHILIFKSPWLKVRKKRWILHYIPLTISVVYPPLFYIVFIFLYPCIVYSDLSNGYCAYPCYIDDTVLFNIDWICNTISPVFIIVFTNVALIIRVFRSMKRIRQQQTDTWKRQKRLTLQLLAFSSVYIIAYLPTTTLAVFRILAYPTLYNEMPHLYNMFHMIYFVSPLQSFLCIFTLPELIAFLKRRVIVPHNVPVATVEPVFSNLGT